MADFNFSAALEEHARLFVAPAIADVLVTPPRNTVVPFDTGELRNSAQVEGPTFTRNTMRMTLTFTADHAYILENVPFIRPTRQDALSWVDPRTGVRAFSSGFSNVHFRWFSEQYVPYVEDKLAEAFRG